MLYETDGTATLDYVYLNGIPLARAGGGGIYYYHTDHLGTPQAMTDSAGTVVWAASYAPFGNATVTTSTITNNLRFPGQYYDAETGLHYNWNRYYDPKTGRYITSDPIGLEGGLNTFTYVDDNPLDMIDVEGLAACILKDGRLRCTSERVRGPEGQQKLDLPAASGNNSVRGCKNNSKCEAKKNVGPAPRTCWRWSGKSRKHADGRRLVPIGDALGRTGIETHSCANPFGPSVKAPYCSEGCITLTKPDVEQLNKLIDAEPGSFVCVTD